MRIFKDGDSRNNLEIQRVRQLLKFFWNPTIFDRKNVLDTIRYILSNMKFWGNPRWPCPQYWLWTKRQFFNRFTDFQRLTIHWHVMHYIANQSHGQVQFINKLKVLPVSRKAILKPPYTPSRYCEKQLWWLTWPYTDAHKMINSEYVGMRDHSLCMILSSLHYALVEQPLYHTW
jgi:hypothetical protein